MFFNWKKNDTSSRAMNSVEEPQTLDPEIADDLIPETPQTPVAAEGGTFLMKLGDLLDLIPREYVREYPTLAWSRNQQVHVTVDRLFGQLMKGRVYAPMSALVAQIPAKFVHGEAFSDQSKVEIPLRFVVKAVGTKDLGLRTNGTARAYKVDGLPNPFDFTPVEPEPAVPVASAAPNPVQQPPSVPVVPKITRFQNVRLYGPPPKPLNDTAREPDLPAPPPQAAPPPPSPAVAGARPADRAVVQPLHPRKHPDLPLDDPRLQGLISALQDIQSALTPPPTPTTAAPAVEPRADVLRLPRHTVAAMLPTGILPEDASSDTTLVTVRIHGLYDQLAKGRVAVPLAALLDAVAPGATHPEVNGAEVTLPLPQVIAALGNQALQDRIEALPKSLDIHAIADPFPIPNATWTPAAPESPTPEETAVDTIISRALSEPDFEEAALDRFAGVNINTATAEMLASLPRVSRRLGERIVAYREEHGPFPSIFDLGEVPGVGRVTFRAITGMPYSPRKVHRIYKLSKLLNLPAAQVMHLPTVARTLAEQNSFTGCVIADREGFLVAAHGVDDSRDAICAMAPRLSGHVRDDLQECGIQGFDSVTVRARGKMMTIVPAGDVLLAAVHETARLTLSQWALIEKVAREIGWLTSRRAYAGPSTLPADAPVPHEDLKG